MRKLLVGLVAVGLLAGPAGATFPGRNGLVAGEGLPADDSHASLLLVGATVKTVGVGNHPAWSPDGKRLVVAKDRGIEIFAVKGMRLTGRRLLVRQGPTARKTGVRWVGIPSWSGDGRYVVYVRQETPRRGADIYKVRVADGRTFRLTHGPYGWVNTDPAWSPDNSTIAYTHCNPSESRCRLALMDADGSHQRVVFFRPGLDLQEPKWSPDGTKLGVTLVDAHQHFRSRAAIFHLASHKLQSVYPEAFATWTPDGRHVVVRVRETNPYGCNYGLRIMTESGHSVRDLPGCLLTGDWQPLH